MAVGAYGDQIVQFIGLQVMLVLTTDVAEVTEGLFVVHIVLASGRLRLSAHCAAVVITCARGVALALPVRPIVIGQLEYTFARQLPSHLLREGKPVARGVQMLRRKIDLAPA